MKTTVQNVEISPIAAFKALAYEPYVLFLDSADPHHPDARYAYVMCDPIEVIASHFDGLSERLSAYHKHETIDGLPPFQGGAAGLLGYDLGRTLENLPHHAKPTTQPDMCVGIYDQVLAFDLHEDKGWLISHTNDNARREALLHKLEKQNSFPTQKIKPDWHPDVAPDAYKENIQRVIDYIAAGDIFQANLAQRFSASLPANFDAAAHYLKLREVNPAPFAAYMNTGSVQIASSSPERFIRCSATGEVETRPIKGTIPAHQDPQILQSSEKDHAENTMIVDLLRNDLSKNCTPESIEAPKLCALESFASVHHLVSTITGQLRMDKSAIDLLRDAFPGGSITGAPKIRAMEIIEELEPTRRGAYCGSIGYIGFDGAMDSNILIRTLVFEPAQVSLGAGGGITLASTPEAEYQETLDKAQAMFESFR